MPWILTAEDVVRRIAGECAFVDERGGGIRLEPGPAALVHPVAGVGLIPGYPCHVPPAQMRQRPVGTGPFKFAEFKPNKSIVGSGGEGCALDSIACIRMPTRNRRALSVLNLKCLRDPTSLEFMDGH
jgi:hypothetical protein